MTPKAPKWIVVGAFIAAATAGVACQEGRHGAIQVSQEECAACHLPEYEATTLPPHGGLFPETCGDCHTQLAWVPAVAINHEWFVLQNRHAELPCTDCHTVGFRPGDTPGECVGCHQGDYDAATMPPHAGYPTDCASCHSDAGWRPSIFDHPWILDGAHLVTPCGSCHAGTPPVYAGTPRDCVGCHRTDYDDSPYPGHDSFPTTCNTCHTTDAWTPALEAAHPEGAFPIGRGPHGGFECLDCHDPSLGPSAGGANADCVGCHTGKHTRERMDEKHREEGDYPRGDAPPNFCLDCHPDGDK
ncbi:MAG: hypothetical protein JRH11_05425 [Deltaproteobacteria bacterium]|nr:hypothetical protein [Deltaproteobacteria bacterium]